MKIVHIATATLGGAGIATNRLHQSLRNNVAEVSSHILQSYPLISQQQGQGIERCTHYHSLDYRIKKKLGILPYTYPLESYRRKIHQEQGQYDMISLPFSYYPIHEHHLVKEADIIHLHWTNDFLDYETFFKSVKQPIVWTLHDISAFMGIYHFRGDKERNKASRLNQIDDELRNFKRRSVSLKSNIHVVCPSEWMCRMSTESDVFKDYPHQVIPNGFNLELFRKLDRLAAKKILNLDNNKKTIFFGADHINFRGKGIDLIVQALKLLPTDKYNLISIGNGQVDTLANVGANYKHLGFVQNADILNMIYSASDVVVLPSREDNLPNMMIESMLNGTPVISFTNGGMSSHITTGLNGILTPEMTPEALANNINDFLVDKYTFDSDEIRQYAIEHFDDKKIAQSYYNLYKSILNS